MCVVKIFESFTMTTGTVAKTKLSVDTPLCVAVHWRITSPVTAHQLVNSSIFHYRVPREVLKTCLWSRIIFPQHHGVSNAEPARTTARVIFDNFWVACKNFRSDRVQNTGPLPITLRVTGGLSGLTRPCSTLENDRKRDWKSADPKMFHAFKATRHEFTRKARLGIDAFLG